MTLYVSPIGYAPVSIANTKLKLGKKYLLARNDQAYLDREAVLKPPPNLIFSRMPYRKHCMLVQSGRLMSQLQMLNLNWAKNTC